MLCSLIDKSTAADYYLRPNDIEILRLINEEITALAKSSSLSNILLAWGRRQRRAISKSISRIFRMAWAQETKQKRKIFSAA